MSIAPLDYGNPSCGQHLAQRIRGNEAANATAQYNNRLSSSFGCLPPKTKKNNRGEFQRIGESTVECFSH